jgi:polyferredoxin
MAVAPLKNGAEPVTPHDATGLTTRQESAAANFPTMYRRLGIYWVLFNAATLGLAVWLTYYAWVNWPMPIPPIFTQFLAAIWFGGVFVSSLMLLKALVSRGWLEQP